MIGDRGERDLQLWPLGLQPLLHPLEDLRRAAGRRVHQEAVLGHPQHGAVVDHHSVDAAHHAVPDRADLQAAHQVGVDAVQQLGGVAALDVDLAQRGAVEDADTATGRGTFAQHRGVHVFTGMGVVTRPLPLPDVLEHGALRDMPVVQRRGADGIEQCATVTPGQRGERNGRIGRPERGGAQRFDGQAEQFGGDAGGDHA